MSEPGANRSYAVFISYRHSDNKELGRQWGSWLHQVLENYDVPADLVGTTNSRGKLVPASLYPVFRDEEELPADADLTKPIRQALENSGLCVVICSPRAVTSSFVAEEVRYFKELGKSDRIIALIIDGEPNASNDSAKQAAGMPGDLECFPYPLRYGVPRKDGTVDWRTRAEPIAADVRPGGMPIQGWTTAAAYRTQLEAGSRLDRRQIDRQVREYETRLELAKLKVVAGALGVPLGVLTQRDKAQQLARARQRTRVLRRWLAAVGVFAILAVIAGILAFQKGEQTNALLGERARLDRAAAIEAHEEGSLAVAIANLARACRDLPDDSRAAEAACILLQQMQQPPALTKQVTFEVATIANPRGTRLLASNEAGFVSLYDTGSGRVIKELLQNNDQPMPRIGLTGSPELFYAVRYDRGVASRFTLLEPNSGEILREIIEPVVDAPRDKSNPMYGDPLVLKVGDTTRLMVSLGGAVHEVQVAPPFKARKLAAFPAAPEGLIAAEGGHTLIWGKGFARMYSDGALSSVPLELEPLRLATFSPGSQNLWTWGDNLQVEVRQYPFTTSRLIRQNVRGAVVSNSRGLVALQTHDGVEVFDCLTSRRLWKAAAIGISSIVFSPNEKYIAVVSQGAAECFGSHDGMLVKRLELSAELPSPDSDTIEEKVPVAVNYSLDSTWLAITTNSKVHFVNTKDSRVVTNPEMNEGERAVSVNFNSLGNRVGLTVESTGDPTAVKEGRQPASRWMLLSMDNWAPERLLDVPIPSWSQGKFSPDGLRVVVSFDQEAQIVDTIGGRLLQRVELPWNSGNLDSILPGEGVFFFGNSSRYRLAPWGFYPIASSHWLLRLAEERDIWDREHLPAIHSVRFSEDDSRVVINDQHVLWLDMSYVTPGLASVQPEPRDGNILAEEDGRILFRASKGQIQVSGSDLLIHNPGRKEPDFRLSGNERPLTVAEAASVDLGRMIHGTWFFSAIADTRFSRVASGGRDAHTGRHSVRWWDLSRQKTAAGLGHEISRFSTNDRVTALALDSGRRRLLVGMAAGGLEMRWLLASDKKVPEWFADLLDYYGMKRADGLTGRIVEFVPTETDAGPIELRRKLEQVLLQSDGDSEYLRILRWALTRGSERTLDPFCELTFRGAADLLIQRASTARELELAYRLDSTNPHIHIEMARFEDDEWRAGFLRDYDLQRMPDDVAMWTRAIRSLHAQKDRERARSALSRLELLSAEVAISLKNQLGL